MQILHHLIRVRLRVFFSSSAVASARQIGYTMHVSTSVSGLARPSQAHTPWRGAGVVERGGLENRCGRKSTEGSNPSLSATTPKKYIILQVFSLLFIQLELIATPRYSVWAGYRVMLAQQLSVKETKNYYGCSRSNKPHLSDFQPFS